MAAHVAAAWYHRSKRPKKSPDLKQPEGRKGRSQEAQRASSLKLGTGEALKLLMINIIIAATNENHNKKSHACFWLEPIEDFIVASGFLLQ